VGPPLVGGRRQEREPSPQERPKRPPLPVFAVLAPDRGVVQFPLGGVFRVPQPDTEGGGQPRWAYRPCLQDLAVYSGECGSEGGVGDVLYFVSGKRGSRKILSYPLYWPPNVTYVLITDLNKGSQIVGLIPDRYCNCNRKVPS
jgi:hypothetical protein